jgi:lipopolysaccharide/colanic/teichoic acid biosynthesis glycosyltransferase
VIKRIFDIVVSAALLIVLFPVALLVTVLVYLKIGSPIFFRQVRPGKRGTSFDLIKFRSMTDERDADGELLPNAKRTTRVGSFLRNTSLDELPSLFNVLVGDMSLVGPRPLKVEYLELYNERQAMRHDVMPGVTGWAQINGRNNLNWNDRFELDVWYVENRTIWLDIKIITITALKVFSREGVDYKENEIVSRFKGNEK